MHNKLGYDLASCGPVQGSIVIDPFTTTLALANRSTNPSSTEPLRLSMQETMTPKLSGRSLASSNSV